MVMPTLASRAWRSGHVVMSLRDSEMRLLQHQDKNDGDIGEPGPGRTRVFFAGVKPSTKVDHRAPGPWTATHSQVRRSVNSSRSNSIPVRREDVRGREEGPEKVGDCPRCITGNANRVWRLRRGWEWNNKDAAVNGVLPTPFRPDAVTVSPRRRLPFWSHYASCLDPVYLRKTSWLQTQL